MKKQKVLWIVWAIIVVIVITLLTILGFMLNKKNAKYYELEDKLKTAAEKYSTNDFIFQDGVNEYTITMDDLKGKYIDNLNTQNDTCTGYVKMTFNVAYEYKAYIKCNNYKTRGYKN